MRKSKIKKRAKKAKKWREETPEKKIKAAFKRLQYIVDYCPKHINKTCTITGTTCNIFEHRLCNYLESQVVSITSQYFKQNINTPPGDIKLIKNLKGEIEQNGDKHN